ncbi:MAG: hypothetical protein HOE79_00810, partial [Euryarchaeota archaeon]|nr:hypothetical protein [Euryarchaeota archaeon]
MCQDGGFTMSRNHLLAVGLVALLFLAPFTALLESNPSQLDFQQPSHADGTDSAPDVPNYRIGDKWIYETKFDVASLITQANVSASINTLTGDTDYEMED